MRNDRVTKAALYARFRVPHYWVLDPLGRRLDEYVLANMAYVPRGSATHGERFHPILFADLTIDLAQVWF